MLALFTAGAVQAQTGSTDVELRQSIARDYEANLGALFDDFHRNPELSGLEVRTAGIMAARLTALYALVSSKSRHTRVGSLSLSLSPHLS